MSFVKRRTEVVKAPSFEQDPRKCAATGCPFRGTAEWGGSRYMCLCHQGKEPDTWPAITEKCHEFSWLGDFIADVMKQSGTWTRGRHWSEFAVEFWSGIDDHCIPNDWERLRAPDYVIRMMDELRWRCGLTKLRPKPREMPHYSKVKGNVVQLSGITA